MADPSITLKLDIERRLQPLRHRHQALWAPGLGVGDLGAGGAFNHRIAVNTWQGVNAPQSPAGTARMRHYSIHLDTPERLDGLLGTLQRDIVATHTGYQVSDPSGNRIVLSTQRAALA